MPYTIAYRGFTVDISAVSDFWLIEDSVKHQLDIVADCGAKPEIMSFFHQESLAVVPGLTTGSGISVPGIFDPNFGVKIDAAVQPPQRPILLHELLHAFHACMLPHGVNNPDVLHYYNLAKDYQLYSANEYLLTNVGEFFAVTASLYLWGNVDREPYTREALQTKQPNYYVWLGQTFGV
jgi:hypothetical protein